MKNRWVPNPESIGERSMESGEKPNDRRGIALTAASSNCYILMVPILRFYARGHDFRTQSMTAAILLAAGRGERMGGATDKAFLSLGSRPMAAYSLLAFQACPDIDAVVLVVRPDKIASSRELCRALDISKLAAVVEGGANRQDSVQAGLAALPLGMEIVAVHDTARPLVSPSLVSRTIQSAETYGSGVAAHRVVDTIKVVGDDLTVSSTPDRAKLWAVETPQTFRADLLRRAYDKVAADGALVTDDAGAVERLGEPVRLVESKQPNFKVTHPADLPLAEAVLRT